MYIKDDRIIKRGNKVTILPQSRLVVNNVINSANKVIPYKSWGKRSPRYENLVLDWDFHSVVIHHSGNWGEKNPVNIERLHLVENRFDHVGYHYLIDSSDKVYEGRELIYKGSHVRHSNTKRIGVLLLGDFNEQWWDIDDELTKAQLKALELLVKSFKTHFPIDKLGGHKEFLPGKGYSCPGNIVMDIIDRIRSRHALQKP